MYHKRKKITFKIYRTRLLLPHSYNNYVRARHYKHNLGGNLRMTSIWPLLAIPLFFFFSFSLSLSPSHSNTSFGFSLTSSINIEFDVHGLAANSRVFAFFVINILHITNCLYIHDHIMR